MSQVLDRVLPRHTFGERHATVVAATPERTYRAIKEATADEMPLVRLLFGLRSLPARLTGHDGLPSTADTSLYDQLVAAGFTVLDDQPGDEIVVGIIDQPWKLDGGEVAPVRDAADFTRFDRPGFVKAAMAFRFEPQDAGTLLMTETRVLATDPQSHRRFACYWMVIRPGSGLIRRSWLRAAKARAQGPPPQHEQRQA